MKTTSVILMFGLMLGAVSIASASDEPARDKSTKNDKPVAAAKVKARKAWVTDVKNAGIEELITGSYLKKRVHRNGMITDGASQVLVVDRGMIDRSGASTVSQVLNRYGAH